jgi:vanillate O-demethylase monooxygenase subunit
MFVKNAWYVAAWSDEVSRQLLSRTILGTPLVFYRTEAGEPVALNDACPHRFLPLSHGRLKGDSIECGYHGMTFDCSGQCTRIPGQENIPRSAQVRTYPLAERWGWLWIWMGDPALADADDIIDIPQLREGWKYSRGERVHFRGNYQLMVDNLMDPSHVTFVHQTTFASGNEAEVPVSTETFDGFVSVSRIVPDTQVPPIYKAISQLTDKAHRYQVYKVQPPSLCVIESGVVASVEEGDWKSVDLAAGDLTAHPKLPPGDHRTVVSLRGFDFMTPETESSTHYFWFMVRNFGVDDPEVERKLTEQIKVAFAEDLVIAEAIQRRIEAGDLPQQSVIAIDRGSVQTRRMLARMLEAEQKNSQRAVA